MCPCKSGLKRNRKLWKIWNIFGGKRYNPKKLQYICKHTVKLFTANDKHSRTSSLYQGTAFKKRIHPRPGNCWPSRSHRSHHQEGSQNTWEPECFNPLTRKRISGQAARDGCQHTLKVWPAFRWETGYCTCCAETHKAGRCHHSRIRFHGYSIRWAASACQQHQCCDPVH